MSEMYSLFYKSNKKTVGWDMIGPWRNLKFSRLEEAKCSAKECKKVTKKKVQICKAIWISDWNSESGTSRTYE